MAEAVFTGEEIEEFALVKKWGGLTSLFAKLSEFSEYFFVSHCPADARDRYRQDEQRDELLSETAHNRFEVSEAAIKAPTMKTLRAARMIRLQPTILA
jgi:hypothetical protein